jgi:hypothetical protein
MLEIVIVARWREISEPNFTTQFLRRLPTYARSVSATLRLSDSLPKLWRRGDSVKVSVYFAFVFVSVPMEVDVQIKVDAADQYKSPWKDTHTHIYIYMRCIFENLLVHVPLLGNLKAVEITSSKCSSLELSTWCQLESTPIFSPGNN